MPSAHFALTTFRYHSPRAPGEGLRIGTSRRPPRGVKKEHWPEYFDVWFPLLGPSPELLKKRPFPFAAYEREIMARAESRQAVELIAALAWRTPISIGCYCEDETHCHRTYLRTLIERSAEDFRPSC